jgi:hypothetical protein
MKRTWTWRKQRGGQQVQSLVYQDDHPFSSHRIALAETLVQWLNTECASTQVLGNENK